MRRGSTGRPMPPPVVQAPGCSFFKPSPIVSSSLVTVLYRNFVSKKSGVSALSWGRLYSLAFYGILPSLDGASSGWYWGDCNFKYPGTTWRHHDGFPQIATGPIASSHIRVLKNGSSGRDPALRGFCNCSHIFEYAALSNTPRAWADGVLTPC